MVTPTRLIFLDLTREKVHSELLLSDLRGVQLKDSHKFYLQFAKGIIHLDDSSGSARDWVDTIDRLVVRVSV